MNILLISQCHKNALKETRRILDQFAERCGERTWQTPITQAGLTTLRKLLRQTARKNTAVACYWTHGKNHTELLWVVGDRRQFNEQGRVPTNRTRRDILRAEDENGWRYAHSIQIMATLAALLHDIGKATLGFRNKLKQSNIQASDPYRHEWISLRLFQAMIHGCATDAEWLARLAQWRDYAQAQPDWDSLIINDSHAQASHDFSSAPPLAQWLMWLIVTHHRLPFFTLDYHNANQRQNLQKASSSHYYAMPLPEWYRAYLTPVPGWVCPPSWQTNVHPQPQQFWQFPPADKSEQSAANQPLDAPAIHHVIRHAMDSATWQKSMSRWANKALNHPPLMALSQAAMPIADPLLLHLSRLCLMVGDHNYSSLKPNDAKRIPADQNFNLYANTDKTSGKLKQTLDEHLCGVGQFTARFARLLPQLPQELPTISARHKPFTARSQNPRFQWQDRAYDLGRSVREASGNQGFFGVNMASTGCGKTLGNARIMHALADPERGLRLTVALGLRVLTLQTGAALRKKLDLDEDSLAVLVGGAANRTLFELNQTKPEADDATATPDFGSESAQALLDEAESVDGMAHISDSAVDADEFGTVIADTKARQLLYAPMVSCTIDHLMQASECLRGGKHIAPMLRLLTSDLILDEPDDFNQADLPALARLVHWAGLLGSRVLLSSATLTPDFVSGLMQAYQAGRAIWAQHQGLPETPVLCAWFDEYTQTSHACADAAEFERQHQQFAEQRAQQLAAEAVRRQAEIWPLKLPKAPEGQKLHFAALAENIVQAAHTLHSAHGEISTAQNATHGKKISVGLVRLANIGAINALAQALLACESLPADTRIHLCCYHARQLLLLRSRLENTLDRLLNRSQPENLFRQAEIIAATADQPEHNHIFIVLASPVSEVGRDHDYDWAIIEPSSMRAIIQLCGRVWRHRPYKTAEQANVLILGSNLRSLRQPNLLLGEATFIYPGFEEKPRFLLRSHRSEELITPEQLAHINAIPRIIKSDMPEPNKLRRLADLEHAVMADLLNPAAPNFLTAYWQSNGANRACVHSQRIAPFRASQRQTDYICLPNNDSAPANNNWDFVFKQSENAWAHPYDADAGKASIRHYMLPNSAGRIQPWLHTDLNTALTQLSELLGENDPTRTALRFATISLPDNQQPTAGWRFNEWLGFGDFK